MLRKDILTSIALVSVLLFSVFASVSSLGAAAYVAEFDTYPFLTVTPNPVGVNQEVYIGMWLSDVPPTAAGAGGDRWQRFTLTVQKPDGTIDVLGPYTSDAVGSAWVTYTPTQVGNYTLQFSFPGQEINNPTPPSAFAPWPQGLIYFKPSNSPKVTLVVQQEKVPPYPAAVLPTDYWERPIYGENREWASIGGAWLVFNPGFALAWQNLYTQAPESAHVMWTKQLAFGGIAGGADDHGFYTGLSYERKFYGLVIAGILYYNAFPSSYAKPGAYAVDIRTGEQLWYNPDLIISFGQVYNYDSPNQHGKMAYLVRTVGTTYMFYDAWTGQWWFNITNVPSGTRVEGPNGEILIYTLNSVAGTLSLWNSSAVTALLGGSSGSSAWQWRPYNKAANGTTGIMWTKNITRVAGNPSIVRIGEGIIYCRATLMDQNIAVHCAYDTDGNLLWVQNRTGLLSRVNFVNVGPMGEGVYAEYVKETMQWYGFDIKTGRQLWVTKPYENAWGMYHGAATIAYGKLFTSSYDGRIHAYDLKTGDELWSYYSGSAGLETPYGHYPFFVFHDSFTVADNKVYAVTGEHSPNEPLYRGEKLHAIDASTGKGLWNISFWGTPPVIADGYLVSFNHYDQKLYSFGKGKSVTTVTAPNIAVPKGTAVLIQGTVLDESVGQKGAPCVAKDSMASWMEYLHMQKPCPAEVKGVPVKLSAIGPDGSVINIGTAVTDGYYGVFSYAWTPPSEGLYNIIATFEGDVSYGSSSASTGLLVGPTPSAYPSLSPTPSPSASASHGVSPSIPPPTGAPSVNVFMIAAIFAVVAAIAVVALVLAKRKK